MTSTSTTSKFNLDKVRFVLEKRNIHDIPCQVKFGMDVSGSIRHLFRDGTIQQVTDKIFTIAMAVDIDKSLDFTAFDSNCYELPAVTEKNIERYIDEHITSNGRYWGGTCYAPVIKSISTSVMTGTTSKLGFLGKLFGGKSVKAAVSPLPPTLAIVITDGANDDHHDTEQAIKDSQNLNVYWQLVGIGSDERTFHFIKEMADKYPNVGYTPITDIKSFPEEDLYDSMLNDEFAEWVANFK
jgi:hypothetical protein